MNPLMRFPTAIWEGFTSRREGVYSKWQIVVWWEHRRVYYNLLLAFVGIFTILVVEFIGGLTVKPGEDVIEPMALVIVVPLFALCANVCYTLGWIIDLILQRSKPSLHLLVTGYGFSAAVTLIPAMFFCVMFVFHKLTGTYI
jgi:hypothetical protein